MSGPDGCSRCGGELDRTGALSGLCVRCLLGLGLEASDARVASLSVARRGDGRQVASLAFGGASPETSDETAATLHRRLRIGAPVVIAGIALFLLRDVATGGVSTPLWSRLLALALQAGAAGILWWRPALTLRQLRALELVLLGTAAVWFATDRYAVTLDAARREDPAGVLFAVTFSVFTYFAFVTAYAVFVPNRWRRAAGVAVTLALCPVTVLVVLAWLHPAAGAYVGQALSFAQRTSLGLMLVIGVVVAVAGSHRIQTLAREAREAREIGQYRLVRRIGTGGMGEVWEAHHRLLARPAAIKLVRPERDAPGAGAEGSHLDLFEREAQATASLRSVHTIELYDFGVTEDGVFYYVMELLEGLDLESLVLRHGPVPAARAVHFMLQACDSLAEAHGHGLVHRDVKPANIYACRMGRVDDFVKVLDFGLVHVRGGPGATVLGGTPAYMPPEAAEGADAIDGRADLYGLGCVGYWLLTGALVFDAVDDEAIRRRHREDPPPPPSTRGVRVPGELEEIVLWCLAKKPDDRPRDAVALARALETCDAAGRWDEADARGWWARRSTVSADRA